jgi:16S rRNA (adenine1518-N6/adenine1519-N6)-dimethyltransferase
LNKLEPSLDVFKISAKFIYDRFPRRTIKGLGQSFLFDKNINRRIVAAAGDLAGKVVVEIGPGPGGLTLEILKQDVRKLYIIELDSHWANVWREVKNKFSQTANDRMTPAFKNEQASNFDRLDIIEGDALKFDFRSLSPQIIISNLPYNVSTQLLFHWLRDFDAYEKLVLMFQKEVADRICASPRTKSYGKLSILAQWKAEVSKVFDLEPGSFFPPPKVKSTVLKFIPFPQERCVCSDRIDEFAALLSRIFIHRRKIVAKSLAHFLDDPYIFLQELNLHQYTRAEEISVQNFVDLFHNYIKFLEKQQIVRH